MSDNSRGKSFCKHWSAGRRMRMNWGRKEGELPRVYIFASCIFVCERLWHADYLIIRNGMREIIFKYQS